MSKLTKLKESQRLSVLSDIYKDWCRKSNTYQMIDIEKKIERENRFYGTNLSR